MNLIQFLKLIKKNLIFLIIVPFILGAMVWYFTRFEKKMYNSSTTVYTGIASGLSMESLGKDRVDFFGSKIEFDNIINIFKARETHKEVALRLFAQGLSLKSWDPRFISKENYLRLHNSTPQYIKDLVVSEEVIDLKQLLKNVPLVLNDTVGLADKKIILENDWYTVLHGENLFSISEKFGVAVSHLMDWNNLTSTQLNAGDQLIISRTEKVVYKDNLNQLDTIDLYVPDENFFLKTNIDSTSFEQTVKNIKNYYNADDTNYIYRLVGKNHSHYSINAISKISPKRVQGSDLVAITYSNTDPGVCYQTLVLIVEAFEKQYSKLKENQSDHIVAYFEQRVKESSALLVAAENKLLKFNQDNDIINYYEQTRHISDQKEQLDKSYYDVKMQYNAADSVVRLLEEKLRGLEGINRLNTSILDYRNKLSELTYKIAINELNENKDPKAVNALNDIRIEAQETKDIIKQKLDSIFYLRYIPEGSSEKDIIAQWLTNLINLEENKARLAALYERKKEFQRTYEIFAPLGARLKRIEREIDVYEQQYLQHLHSLNQAKLKQQNLEFKSNIKVVDPPYLPSRPQGSKRTVFIAAAAIVGFVLVLFVILVLEYLDQTMKFLDRAPRFTGLELVSAFPLLSSKKKGKINFDYLQSRSLQILYQNLFAIFKKHPQENGNQPKKILFFSTQPTDGKSIIQELLSQELRKIGHQVLSLNYNLESYKPKYYHQQEIEEDYFTYNVNADFFTKNTIAEILDENEIQIEKPYDYILFELPSITQHTYPPELVKEFDVAVMIVRSNRTWQKSDIGSLDAIKGFLRISPVVFLNGINPEHLQEIVGEIPKKRSRIRRIIKKIVRLQVFERYQLKKW